MLRLASNSALAAQLVGAEKRYGSTTALRGIDLDLPRGQVVALLGPNGAWKLRVRDLAAADTGTLVSWELGLQTN